MDCASCNRSNRAGARFCAGCGGTLAPRCPACGAETAPDAQFCDACGASLASTAGGESAGTRKVVTILFADLVGSTSLQERLDAESTRRVMERYDRTRVSSRPELAAHQRAALERFLASLLAQDARGLEAILREDVEASTDGGGAYTALHTALRGRGRVAHFFLRAALHRRVADPTAEIRVVNGLPALLISLGRPVRRQAPRTLIRCDLDDAGKIRGIHAILAPRKRAAVRFGGRLESRPPA